MPSRYNLNLRKIAAEVEAHIDEEQRAFELAKRRYEENPMYQLYRRYGVDNDFDLIEAMYKARYRSTSDAFNDKWCVDLRIKCGMDPEYTERCLMSPAFMDVRDEILRRIHDA